MIAPHELEGARAAPILTVLAELGLDPTRRAGREYYFHSPLRSNDKTPSFSVNEELNLWRDHGTGEGGNCLDLVLQLTGSTLPEAVRYLLPYSQRPSTPAPSAPQLPDGQIIHFRDELLTDTSLLRYLAERRGLNLQLLTTNKLLFGRYLRQAEYQRAGRTQTYRSVAWRNDAGGWVLRSIWKQTEDFKANHGTASYTLVPAARPGATTLLIFEGFINYLSSLQMAGFSAYDTQDVLILNSTSNARAALAITPRYQLIWLCLDNDKAGDDTTTLFTVACAHATVKDLRTRWAGYNDLNDKLCNRPMAERAAAAATARKPAAPAPPQARDTAKWWLWLKWNAPQADAKTGQVFEEMTYYSFGNEYPDKARLKVLLKKLLGQGKVAVARLCERVTGGEGATYRILEQWPKPQ